MKSSRLEPGILNLFRLFLLVQFGLMLVNLLVHHARGYMEEDPSTAIAVVGVSTLVLFGYLSWPALEKRLGRFYLPLGLGYSSVFSLLAKNLFLTNPVSVTSGGTEESAWQLFLFLSVPLVLVAWQYGLLSVIGYSVFTTLLDFILVVWTQPDYELFAQTYHRLLFIRFLSFLLIGFVIARIMQQLRHERQALQEANTQLERYVGTLEQLTVSRERNRVARELHDTVAHTLSGMAVELEAVDSLWNSRRNQARQILRHSLQATRDGLQETRRAIQELRAAPLEDLGLVSALREAAETASDQAGFFLTLSLPPDLSGLPPEVEQCFYRIAQEAFENIARHANARSVRMSFEGNCRGVRMEIDDDGSGYDPQSVSAGRHFGLRGMQERAQIIGACLVLDSHPGAGAHLSLVWSAE